MGLRVRLTHDIQPGVAVCVWAKWLSFCATHCSLTHNMHNVICHRGAVKFWSVPNVILSERGQNHRGDSPQSSLAVSLGKKDRQKCMRSAVPRRFWKDRLTECGGLDTCSWLGGEEGRVVCRHYGRKHARTNMPCHPCLSWHKKVFRRRRCDTLERWPTGDTAGSLELATMFCGLSDW